MKLFSQAVDLDAQLIHTRRLLPQTVLLVAPRQLSDGPGKPPAQGLALFNRPGFLDFVREKVGTAITRAAAA